jgi:hypothetical protein
MNRRDFFTVMGGASVASLAGVRPAVAAGQSTNLYLSGLLMVSLEDEALRIGFPKAHGHKATMKIVPITGSTRTVSFKGNGVVETSAVGGRPEIFAPEVVRMSEIYGPDVTANFDKCPSVIEIPYAAIKSITTSKVSKDRWTFVRADNKQEIDSFRPRQIAESLKLELTSSSVLKLGAGKTVIKLGSIQEILCNYAPEPQDTYPDMYLDHFVHYVPYIDRPPAADFLIEPKNLTGVVSGASPRVGHRMLLYQGSPFCFVILFCGSMSLCSLIGTTGN